MIEINERNCALTPYTKYKIMEALIKVSKNFEEFERKEVELAMFIQGEHNEAELVNKVAYFVNEHR
jgi:hypothetical protein